MNASLINLLIKDKRLNGNNSVFTINLLRHQNQFKKGQVIDDSYLQFFLKKEFMQNRIEYRMKLKKKACKGFSDITGTAKF